MGERAHHAHAHAHTPIPTLSPRPRQDLPAPRPPAEVAQLVGIQLRALKQQAKHTKLRARGGGEGRPRGSE